MFKWITLEVRDMAKSLDFYQKIVGLTIDRHIQAPGLEIYFLGQGQTKVELIAREDVKEVDMGQSVSLGFEVDSLEDKMAFIKDQGLDIHSGPFSPDEKTSFFYVLDPSGMKIQFVEIKD